VQEFKSEQGYNDKVVCFSGILFGSGQSERHFDCEVSLLSLSLWEVECAQAHPDMARDLKADDRSPNFQHPRGRFHKKLLMFEY
jgi:hypothetical protein